MTERISGAGLHLSLLRSPAPQHERLEVGLGDLGDFSIGPHAGGGDVEHPGGEIGGQDADVPSRAETGQQHHGQRVRLFAGRAAGAPDADLAAARLPRHRRAIAGMSVCWRWSNCRGSRKNCVSLVRDHVEHAPHLLGAALDVPQVLRELVDAQSAQPLAQPSGQQGALAPREVNCRIACRSATGIVSKSRRRLSGVAVTNRAPRPRWRQSDPGR